MAVGRSKIHGGRVKVRSDLELPSVKSGFGCCLMFECDLRTQQCNVANRGSGQILLIVCYLHVAEAAQV